MEWGERRDVLLYAPQEPVSPQLYHATGGIHRNRVIDLIPEPIKRRFVLKDKLTHRALYLRENLAACIAY